MSLDLYIVLEEKEVWSGNITHNLTKMAEKIMCGFFPRLNLYDLLWRPEENGFTKVTIEYIILLMAGAGYLKSHREILEQYNPENGWGSYDTLVKFVSSLIEFLLVTPNIENEKYEIHSSI